jgi:membrane-associated phospholipid phosphatase
MFKALHQKIVYWDHAAWFYLNTQWHNSFLDIVMPFLRNQWFWSPLYLFLLLFMTAKFGKQGWFWCIGFLVTFILADQVSATFIKPFFHRVRPCNNPALTGIVHIIVDCGSGKSFPSTHATNHFALALFSALTLGRLARWVWPVALLWAASVGYAQIYVGVHYPFDVLGGAMLGSCIGILTGTIFNSKFGLEPRPSA